MVIVSYRCREYLRRCLTSIEDHSTGAELSVTVIDNASGDGIVDMVTNEFGDVEFTVNPDNRGFAASTNAGIRAGDAPYVLVLNPDTRLGPGVLDRLLAVFAEHDDVAICGPVLLQSSGNPDQAAARSFPTPLSALGHFVNLSRVSNAPEAVRRYIEPTDRSGPVDAVNGAFMLIRRDALEEVGLFDQGYWMYMEDLDLCYRMQQAGWHTWFEASVQSEHVKGGSTGPYRNLRLNYAFHYGMYRFYRKFYASEHPKVVNAAVYAGIVVKLLISSVRSVVGRTLLRLGLIKR